MSHPELTLLARTKGCDANECPTIYRKDASTYVVQGYDASGLFTEKLPDGELAVSIPAQLIEDLFGTPQEATV